MGIVAGLFDAWGDARQSLEALRQAGFHCNDFSVVGRYCTPTADPRDEQDGLEVLDDLVVGLATVTVPEIGPALAAGPLSASLTGGLLGALADQGILPSEIQDFRTGVDRGGILVTVNAPAARDTEVRILLRQNGLRDLSEHRRRWDENPGYRYDSNPASSPKALDAPAPAALVSALNPRQSNAAETAA